MTRLSSHLLKGLNKTAQSHYPLGDTHFEPPFPFPPPALASCPPWGRGGRSVGDCLLGEN